MTITTKEDAMQHWAGIRKYSLVGLVGIGLSAVIACAGGVTQTDYDSVKQQLALQEQRVAGLQGQLSTFQQQLTTKDQNISDLQQKLTVKDKEGAAAAQKPSASTTPDGVTTVLGVRKIPPPSPPTPVPAGYVAPAKPTPPPSLYESVGPFAFYVETLATNHSAENLASTIACVPSGAFKRGMFIVWRFEVIDTESGKRVTDRDGATVKIRIPNADDVTARFSQRGGGRVATAPWMWSAGWDIPMNYALGALDYTIVVTKGDKTATWKAPALVEPGEDSRLQIVG